jgi:HEAT repeat protein
MRASHRLLVAALLLGPPLPAQSLDDRVSSVRDGAVVFSYAARPEACGDGERMTGFGTSNRSYVDGSNRPCLHAPAQVRITMLRGEVRRIESWIGPRTREGRDLGQVAAAEAARYLLGIATRNAGAPGARAISAAVFADSAVVWPTLLRLARDTISGSRSVRQEATLWLSRFAIAALGGHPATLGDDDEESDEVKLQAVFVLSQLPNREGIEPLLEVARRPRAELGVRQRALFWLGQSGDARAVSLFESLLRG